VASRPESLPIPRPGQSSRSGPGSAVQSRGNFARDACPAQPGPSLSVRVCLGLGEKQRRREADKVAVLARLFASPSVIGQVALTARPSASRAVQKPGCQEAVTSISFPTRPSPRGGYLKAWPQSRSTGRRLGPLRPSDCVQLRFGLGVVSALKQERMRSSSSPPRLTPAGFGK
jgi:hypothetical protein